MSLDLMTALRMDEDRPCPVARCGRKTDRCSVMCDVCWASVPEKLRLRIVSLWMRCVDRPRDAEAVRRHNELVDEAVLYAEAEATALGRRREEYRKRRAKPQIKLSQLKAGWKRKWEQEASCGA